MLSIVPHHRLNHRSTGWAKETPHDFQCIATQFYNAGGELQHGDPTIRIKAFVALLLIDIL